MPRTVPSGPIFLPRMFRGDQFFCRGRSGGLVLGGDQFSCDRASQLNRTTGTIFLVYIYIYHGRCHTANRLRVSKLTQLTIFYTSSPRVYRHGDSSRRCTVATVQDEANPSSSQPAASCCVASESTEAHRDGCREYVLAEESVLPRKQPKRKRGV